MKEIIEQVLFFQVLVQKIFTLEISKINMNLIGPC